MGCYNRMQELKKGDSGAMLISVGLELNNEGRALAWALDYPGCFAYGAEGPDAVVALARQLVEYEEWVNRHAGPGSLELGDFDLRIVDSWQVYTIDDHYNLVDGGYAVNAWFRQDWKPLEVEEINRGLQLMGWSRVDLLDVVSSLSNEQWDRTYAGERWNVRGIVRHVANADWWYMQRLGLDQVVKGPLPKDTMERLTWVRARLMEALEGMASKELVLGKEGEFWSPRKLLRRVLWHEIDHRQHILKLIKSGESGPDALI